MNKATWIAWAGAALMLVGCKSRMLEAAQAYEREACACKDSACATAAATRFAEAAKKHASSPAPSDDAAYRSAVQSATECVAARTMPKLPENLRPSPSSAASKD